MCIAPAREALLRIYEKQKQWVHLGDKREYDDDAGRVSRSHLQARQDGSGGARYLAGDGEGGGTSCGDDLATLQSLFMALDVRLPRPQLYLSYTEQDPDDIGCRSYVGGCNGLPL